MYDFYLVLSMKPEADFERLHMYYRVFQILPKIQNEIIGFGFYYTMIGKQYSNAKKKKYLKHVFTRYIYFLCMFAYVSIN